MSVITEPATDTPVAQRWPGGAVANPNRRRMVLIGVSLIATLQGTEPQINAVSLAAAGKQFGMSAATLSLATSLGTLLLAASMLGIGIIGDLRGRKKILVIGTFGMALGSVICALAPSSAVLILGRGVEGISTAASFGMALALVPTVFFPHELPRVFAIWLAIQSGVMTLGSVASGVLNSALGWRASYLFIPVLAVVFALLCVKWLPESRATQARKFDTAGVLLAAVALITLIGGIGQASQRGWTSPVVLGGIGIAVVLFAVFGWHESHTQSPGFPVTLFKIPAFTAACVVGVAFNFANAVLGAQLPSLWQKHLGYSAFTSSLYVAAMPLFMAIGAMAAGQVAKRFGASARFMFTSGMLILTVGISVMVFQGLHTGYWLAFIGLACVGFGIMWTQNPQSAVIMGAAPSEMVGAVGAVKPAVGQLGYGLGFGMLVPIVASISNSALASSGGDQDLAYVKGFSGAMLISAGIMLACTVAVFVLMSTRKARDLERAAHEPLPAPAAASGPAATVH